MGGITCIWSGIHLVQSGVCQRRAVSYFQREDNEGVLKEVYTHLHLKGSPLDVIVVVEKIMVEDWTCLSLLFRLAT